MASLEGFDATSVEPKTDFEPLPPGDYSVVAVNSTFKPTSKGDGEYLQFDLEVIDGPFRGRRLFDRLNLKNKNDQAVRIAQATLSSMCRAVGVLRPKDSAELHNKPMLAKVDLEARADKPGAYSNRVKNYEPAGGGRGHAPQSQGGSQQSASADTSVPPWKRKSA